MRLQGDRLVDNSHGFLSDGVERARHAAAPIVRAEIERTFSDEIANTPAADQPQLRAKIEDLIANRLDELAPPDALY